MIQMFYKNNSGFSLIEIMVALSIVALLGGFMLVNYNQKEESNDLVMEAHKLAGYIRTAQNNTLGAVEYGDTIPDGGWGIHMDLSNSKKSYKLFANTNYKLGNDDNIDSREYDNNEAEPNKGGRTIKLKQGIKIASTTIGDQLDVTFVPPDPKTVIYNGTATSSEASIILRSNKGKTRKVKINSFGLIEVKK